MSLIVKDRVLETTITTGTGALTLAGAVTGFQQFSAACAVNDVCYYMIEAIDSSGVPTGDWETGLGAYSALNTLTRSYVLASSNAGALVSLSTGTKRVGISLIAGSMASAAAIAGVPATIPDLLFWYEPSNMLASIGANVQILQNLTPWYTGLVASPTTGGGATIDSATLNGYPVINTANTTSGRYAFTGTASSALVLTNSTVFVVFKSNAISNTVSQSFISGLVNSFEFSISGTGVGVGTLELLKTAVASIGTATASSISVSTWYQANATYASVSGAYAFRIGRATAGSGTNIQSITAANTSFFYNVQNGTEDLNSKIAALIVYNRVLTGTEISNVETYLNAKYGV